MEKFKINRRNVLKTVGVTSGLAIAGNVQATKTNLGPIRLVEVGVKYDLQDRNDYRRTNVDGDPQYFVDSQKRIVLRTPLPDSTKDIFKNNRHVVGSFEINSMPADIGGSDPMEAVTTTIAQQRLPTERVRLAEPHQLPQVEVHEENGVPVLIAGDHHETLEPGTSESYRLKSQRITAVTARLTDETASIEGIPEYRLGPKTEYDKIELNADPIVTVKDHGDLPVVEIQEK